MILLWLELEHLWLCIYQISQGKCCQDEVSSKEIPKYADIDLGDKENNTSCNFL